MPVSVIPDSVIPDSTLARYTQFRYTRFPLAATDTLTAKLRRMLHARRFSRAKVKLVALEIAALSSPGLGPKVSDRNSATKPNNGFMGTVSHGLNFFRDIKKIGGRRRSNNYILVDLSA